MRPPQPGAVCHCRELQGLPPTHMQKKCTCRAQDSMCASVDAASRPRLCSPSVQCCPSPTGDTCESHRAAAALASTHQAVVDAWRHATHGRQVVAPAGQEAIGAICSHNGALQLAAAPCMQPTQRICTPATALSSPAQPLPRMARVPGPEVDDLAGACRVGRRPAVSSDAEEERQQTQQPLRQQPAAYAAYAEAAGAVIHTQPGSPTWPNSWLPAHRTG